MYKKKRRMHAEKMVRQVVEEHHSGFIKIYYITIINT